MKEPLNKISTAAQLVIQSTTEKHLPSEAWKEAHEKAIDALQTLWELERDHKDTR